MKRWMRVFLLLAPALCCLCGCGKEEKKQLTLTLKLPPMSMSSDSDPEITNGAGFFEKACAAFSEQYEEAEVHFQTEVFEYVKEDEAIQGCFDTEGAADVLFEGYFNMETYVHTGRVVPLDDVVSDSLRADVDEALWEMSLVNGKTYMMPYMSVQNVMVYNRELFRQCGLEEYLTGDGTITAWTLAEWEEILDTLADRLPDNCYPLMMYGKNDQGDTHIMTLLRSHGCPFFDADGYLCLETEEGIAALKWLQDGYGRCWYPPQCERLEMIDNVGLFQNGQLAIAMANSLTFHYYEEIDFGCVNFPDISGNGIATSFITGFEVFDNGDPDKVAAAKAFVRYIMETDRWAESSANGLPARSSVAEKYKDEIPMLDAFMENRRNLVDITRNSPNWRGVRDVFYRQLSGLLTGEATPEETAVRLDEACNAAIRSGWEKSVLYE